MSARHGAYESLNLSGNPFVSVPPISSYESTFRNLFSAREREAEQLSRYASGSHAMFVVAPYGGGKTVVLLEALARLRGEDVVTFYTTYQRDRGFRRSLLDQLTTRSGDLGAPSERELPKLLRLVREYGAGNRKVVLAVDDLDRAADLAEVFAVTHDVRELLGEGAAVVITGQPFGVTSDLNTSAGGLFRLVKIPEFSAQDFHEMLTKYLASVRVSARLSETHPFDAEAAEFICSEFAAAVLTPRLFNSAIFELIEIAVDKQITLINLQELREDWSRVSERAIRSLTSLQMHQLEILDRAGGVSEDADAILAELGGSELVEYPDVLENVLRPFIEKDLVHARNIFGKEELSLTPQASAALRRLLGTGGGSGAMDLETSLERFSPRRAGSGGAGAENQDWLEAALGVKPQLLVDSDRDGFVKKAAVIGSIPVGEIRGAIDIAIITILQEEFEAVLERFGSRCAVRGGRQIYEYCEVVSSQGQRCRVAVSRAVGQGQVLAQSLTHDVISDLRPSWLFLAGIAGGVPDSAFSLGDVLLASRLHDFSVSAALEGRHATFQQMGGPMDPEVDRLLAALPAWRNRLGDWNGVEAVGLERPTVVVPKTIGSQMFYGTADFRRQVRKSLLSNFPVGLGRRRPVFRVGPGATANVLVKQTDLLIQWQESARHLSHVEMEAGGAYEAARKERVPLLCIRGISDIVGLRREAQWTTYACHSAAAFISALIGCWSLLARSGPERGVTS